MYTIKLSQEQLELIELALINRQLNLQELALKTNSEENMIEYTKKAKEHYRVYRFINDTKMKVQA